MGNGAGKNKNVVREIGPDDDIVDGNDDYYERLEEQAKKGSTASKPMLGGLFGAKKERAKVQKKKAPKIVGLIDSDEEDQGGGGDAVGGASRDDGARQAARRAATAAVEHKSEFLLNNDINDLEKTLNSIGVYGNEKRKKGHATVSAPSGTVDHNEFLQSSQFSRHTRFPPGASAGASRHHYQSQFSRTDRRTSLVGHLAGGGMNSKVRFSWDNKTGGGAEGAGESEDWTYNKTVIDGFDPDKFRQVNNRTTAAAAATTVSSNRPNLDRSFSVLGSSTEMDMPGAVPTYDRAEQKLIASLEQELGVL